MSELEASVKEEHPPPYIIFVVVFFFFLTGLGGFLVCHLLKKKGYRCHVEDDEEEEEKLGENEDDDDEENQDTVEQILKCIIENEANMEAFNEMLGNRNVCVRHDPRLRKESIGGIPPHLHTVHSGTDHNTCHLCAQGRSKKGRRPSRTPRLKQRPGEQTVFSVGRFRVTHTDKKNPDSSRVPDVLVGSGDHLDRSQDSDERKDGGYNLRNMFKDVRPSSDNANGMPPIVGKRRRSLTLFGLRRGSDPTGVKVVSTGREGVKFIPQPVVLEEPQNENGESGVRPFSKLRSESVQNQVSVVKMQAKNSIATDVEAPNTLPISPSSFPNPSSQMENEDSEKQFDPVQTSTPLCPIPDPGIGSVQFTAKSRFQVGLPGTQTPPDPCASPVLEQSSFASPALISLGSSPHSSIKTPTSPLAITPSPKFSSKGAPKLTSSPKLTSNPPVSSQTSSLSVSLQDDTLSLEPNAQEPCFEGSAPTKGQTEPPDASSHKSNEKPELQNLGVLSADIGSPQLTPSSPLGGRISSVTIVKASPDSKREFSVVTMAESASVAAPNAEELQVDPSGTEVTWTLGDYKDDVVEMEDIKECKVTRAEDVEKLDKTTTSDVKQD